MELKLIKRLSTYFWNLILNKKKIPSALKQVRSEVDRLVDYSNTSDYSKLETLDLLKIYKEFGRSFGNLLIIVQIKSLKKQNNSYTFSKLNQGKIGKLYPALRYTNHKEPYATVQLEGFDIPIKLCNLIIRGYNEYSPDYKTYLKKFDN